MLIDWYLAVSCLASAATAAFTPISWWWALPLALGYFVALIIIHLLFALILSLLIDQSKPVTGSIGGFYRFMTVHTIDGIMKIARVRVSISGTGLIPGDRPFLLVSNHLSRFDPMICMVYLRRYPLAFVSKPENFRIPIAGGFIHKCKFISIDRDNPRNAVKSLITASEYIKTGELSVGIYPEGTRSKTGELLPFRDGIFKVARDTSAPIVVMTVRNTDMIARNFPLRSTHVDVRVLKVIQPEEYAGLRASAISALARECMERDLNCSTDAVGDTGCVASR